MTDAWDTAKIREAFIYDGGEADYHDPISGAQTQRKVAGEIFDRWLAAHDAEVRAEAESDPAKDERLVRYMAMVTPLGYQSALTVVQEMTKLLATEEIARASVVPEEPEWEYGFGWHYVDGSVVGVRMSNREDAEEHVQWWPEDDEGVKLFVVQRRPQRAEGPWLPVEQGGE
jgi:hypothetical protein